MELGFSRAKPVWLKDAMGQKNCTAGFRVSFSRQREKVFCALAASSVYRLFVNGKFIAYGPARGPHGYARVDRVDLTPDLKQGDNTVAIEVLHYGVNSFSCPKQSPFLQAELLIEDRVIAATAVQSDEGLYFEASRLKSKIQKVQRYSFQRPFCESYRMQKNENAWRCGAPWQADMLQSVPQPELLDRGVPMPDFFQMRAQGLIAQGRFELMDHKIREWPDRSYNHIGRQLEGFTVSELDLFLSDELLCIAPRGGQSLPKTAPISSYINENEYFIADFGRNQTGFICLKLNCQQPCRLIMTFDEILTHGDVDPLRLDAVNAISLELQPGSYDFMSFEPYTLRYLKIMMVQGICCVDDWVLCQYQNPCEGAVVPQTLSPAQKSIFEAGMATYSQNAVDLFMDCPSRERAGWLCDSFFTARVEYDLTGKCLVERNFLENYLLPETFAFLPPGMLPMCYPSDHYDGSFIPNWPMWLILQLEEYLQRSHDRPMVDAFYDRIYALLQYFQLFENDQGLLEKLEGWVFVEWSAANDFVQDVNFPTNMLYAAALDAAGRLYGDPSLCTKAKKLRERILSLAWNGEFFLDHAMRNEKGELQLVQEDISEACQYYAFFTNTASVNEFPKLWETLCHDFAPQALKRDQWPQVQPGNMFIGNYLRLDLLEREGQHDQVLEEIVRFFLPMAEATGTLWEHNQPKASCCHGFASHVIHWLAKRT